MPFSVAAREKAAIVLLIAVMSAGWLPGLGYYHDDWSFLARMRLSPDQSMEAATGCRYIEGEGTSFYR